jgi:beta-lactamase class A
MTGRLDLLGRSLERIAAGVRADWGVYIKFLATGDEIDLNADATMDTMSVIKLPLLIELYGQAERGRIDLAQWLTLRADDMRLGTGILHLLKDGATLTLSDAAKLMIVQSDNIATDLCFAAVGAPRQSRDWRAHSISLRSRRSAPHSTGSAPSAQAWIPRSRNCRRLSSTQPATRRCPQQNSRAHEPRTTSMVADPLGLPAPATSVACSS